MSRRSAGEGTVRWHKSGLCEARLYVPKELRHLVGGKSHLSFYARKEKEALAKRKKALSDLEDGRSLRADGLTVGEYLEAWISGPLKQSVATRTYDDYRYRARKYIIPEIGHVELAKLTAFDLDDLYAKKTAEGLGPRSVNYIHAIIRVALQRAVKKRLIPYNVARDADPPSMSEAKREYVTLDKEQVGRFFAAAAELEDRFEALFILAVCAGLRPGELLALKWEDVSLPPGGPGEMRIRRALSETKSEGMILRNTTKTGKGRLVYLFPEVAGALRAHKKRQNEERLRYRGLWEDHGLIFPNSRGGLMTPNNLTRRHFRRVLEHAGLPRIRLYDLRHTFATLWLESGENPKVLQEILGHSRITLTLDTYSHVLPHIQREAVSRFAKLFESGQ